MTPEHGQEPGQATRILIADDHRLFREGLKALISVTPGLQVVAEAQNGLEAVEAAAQHGSEVVIMDISRHS